MTKTEFIKLACDLDNRDVWIRRRCPFCGAFAMMIKYPSERYDCGACEREGDIEEVKQKYYGDFMRQKSSVHI